MSEVSGQEGLKAEIRMERAEMSDMWEKAAR
jgi:hypothetical protein